MKKIIYLITFLCLFTACKNDDPGDVVLSSEEINVIGTNYAESKKNFTLTYSSLLDSLVSNEAISIIAEVDHAANARSVGRVVNPSRIIFFGNPFLGTPLMQKNQLAGLDLPQKIFIYQNSSNSIYAIYNSVPYLESRHGLQGVNTLPQISTALENLVKTTTDSDIKSATELTVTEGQGIISIISDQNFEETYAALQNAISGNKELSIIAQLDHQINAENAGLELRPTKIMIFENSNLEAPLLQDQLVVGLDLPLKILVWEDENGDVNISYNDPSYLQERYGLEANIEELELLSTALDNLAKTAAGN